jgi:hypothetical protein
MLQRRKIEELAGVEPGYILKNHWINELYCDVAQRRRSQKIAKTLSQEKADLLRRWLHLRPGVRIEDLGAVFVEKPAKERAQLLRVLAEKTEGVVIKGDRLWLEGQRSPERVSDGWENRPCRVYEDPSLVQSAQAQKPDPYTEIGWSATPKRVGRPKSDSLTHLQREATAPGSNRRRAAVKRAIAQCLESGEIISAAELMRRAGVSQSYLARNDDLRAEFRRAMDHLKTFAAEREQKLRALEQESGKQWWRLWDYTEGAIAIWCPATGWWLWRPKRT